MTTTTATQTDSTALITDALAHRGLPVGSVLRVFGPAKYGAPSITVRDDEAGLYVSVEQPATYHNPGETWRLWLPVEVIIQHHEADPERVSRLHEVAAGALREMGFMMNEEEVCGPDSDDGCHTHQSDWTVDVADPDQVAEIVERLMGVPTTQYPDGDSWMWMPVPLSADQVVGLIAMGVPVEDENGNFDYAPTVGGGEA